MVMYHAYGQEYQARVNASTDLDDLCKTLNSIAAELVCDGFEYSLDDIVDVCGFPTFGGSEPPSLDNIWSWDATREMTYDIDADRGYYITPRTIYFPDGE